MRRRQQRSKGSAAAGVTLPTHDPALEAARLEFLQQCGEFCDVTHRAAGIEGQVLTEDVAAIGQRLDDDLSERAGLGRRRCRMERAEMINPARRLGRCLQRRSQRRTANKCQEFASLHRGTLLFGRPAKGRLPDRISRDDAKATITIGRRRHIRSGGRWLRSP